MDEELLLENIETIEEGQEEGVVLQDSVDVETSEGDIGIAEFDDELDNDSSMEETTLDVLDVETVEEIEIEVNEAIGWVSGDAGKHYGLTGRDEDNQHPISAITGLREKLSEIERLKVVESSGINVANYYKWEGNKAYDIHGYFVSLISDQTEIKICEGSDIFGVTVDSAGFIGGQNTLKRDNHYGLVVISGLVDVRCELDINVGDCVVSNAYGYAKKSASNYGYKVLGTETKNGVPYAIIALGTQADVTNALGENLQAIDTRLNTVETNIVSAVNVANQAYNKASEIGVSNREMSDKVDGALGVVDKVVIDVEDLGKQVSNSVLTSVQAKAIAESAATSAESMRNEAVEKVNNALADTAKLRDDFAKMENGITEVEGRISIVEKNSNEQGDAIAGIQVDVGKNSSSINDLVSWQDDANTAMARIEQKADSNGAYIQSTVANLDKYSVGPLSQSNGFTLDQAKSILTTGIIYVPTDTHTETTPVNRDFTKQYYYTWDGEKWVTSNSVAVAFFDNYLTGGSIIYWYIPGADNIVNDGITYNSHTLYKWESNQWVAVATLAGNSQNRAISNITQTSNKISAEVVNAIGDYASLDARITDEVSQVSMVATKLLDNGEINAAAIVASVNDSESSVAINANKIVLSGDTFFVDKDGNTTTIDGSHITAGTVTANYIDSVNGNIGGFKIGNNALYTTLKKSVAGADIEYHMTSPKDINYVLYLSEESGFSYLGTDGIGTMKVIPTDGVGNADYSTFNTWMSGGEFFSNRGTIGGWQISTDGLRNTGESSGAIISDGHDCETVIKYGSIVNRSTVESGNYALYNKNRLDADELMFMRSNDSQVRSATLSWYIDGESLDPITGQYIIPFRINADTLLFGERATNGELRGTWKLESGVAVTSWSGAKHDIESLDDRYSVLFDNIEPVRFKYNNGQSDRYHTGFILDELKSAMDVAGIDSSEFAAYCVSNPQTGEGGIRYEEIIALLVKEVQTLKKEIKEIKENG